MRCRVVDVLCVKMRSHMRLNLTSRPRCCVMSCHMRPSHCIAGILAACLYKIFISSGLALAPFSFSVMAERTEPCAAG